MSDLMGHTLGQYRIVRRIGKGGMAEVYLAEQPSMHRQVAVKVLPQHFLQDETFLERFMREVQVIARLEHPRILPVYDFGEEGGQPYIVMRYISGGTLAERIAEGPLPLEEVVRLLWQIAEGLEYAHQRGVIHRDFKPSNVLLDEHGNIYLADFGIARVAETTAQLTGSGIVGTPAYIAPEMAESQPPTHQVDVYALGVTLFQMLTGELPYKADTPMGLLMAHVSKPIPDVRVLRPDLPPAVQYVIERAMAKNPSYRYRSAMEVADALEKALRIAPEEVEEGRTQVEGTLYEATDPYATLDPNLSRPYIPTTPTAIVPPKRSLLSNPLLWIGAGAAAVALIAVAGVLMGALALRSAGLAPTAEGTQPLILIAETAVEVTSPSVLQPSPTAAESTATPTPLPTATPLLTATIDPAYARAFSAVYRNSDWRPIIRAFNGVPMALVPVGCFTMGSSYEEYTWAYEVCLRTVGEAVGPENCIIDLFVDESPEHVVCFDRPFWIDVTEVTNALFGSGGLFQQPDLPRENVSWFEAVEHCAARGGRLPTEAEWEYVARGPDGLRYPWGNDFDPMLVNYCDAGCKWGWKDERHSDGANYTAPVGSYPGGASWVGALDMAGNVFEWVNSLYQPYPYSPFDGREVDGASNYTDWRVLRGGAWSSTKEGVRAANRGLGTPDTRDSLSGFRCVRDFDAAVGR